MPESSGQAGLAMRGHAAGTTGGGQAASAGGECGLKRLRLCVHYSQSQLGLWPLLVLPCQLARFEVRLFAC